MLFERLQSAVATEHSAMRVYSGESIHRMSDRYSLTIGYFLLTVDWTSWAISRRLLLRI